MDEAKIIEPQSGLDLKDVTVYNATKQRIVIKEERRGATGQRLWIVIEGALGKIKQLEV